MDIGLESQATSIMKTDARKHCFMHFLTEGQTKHYLYKKKRKRT